MTTTARGSPRWPPGRSSRRPLRSATAIRTGSAGTVTSRSTRPRRVDRDHGHSPRRRPARGAHAECREVVVARQQDARRQVRRERGRRVVVGVAALTEAALGRAVATAGGSVTTWTCGSQSSLSIRRSSASGTRNWRANLDSRAMASVKVSYSMNRRITAVPRGPHRRRRHAVGQLVVQPGPHAVGVQDRRHRPTVGGVQRPEQSGQFLRAQDRRHGRRPLTALHETTLAASYGSEVTIKVWRPRIAQITTTPPRRAGSQYRPEHPVGVRRQLLRIQHAVRKRQEITGINQAIGTPERAAGLVVRQPVRRLCRPRNRSSAAHF